MSLSFHDNVGTLSYPDTLNAAKSCYVGGARVL